MSDGECLERASEYLAQLTGGDITGLTLNNGGRDAAVVNYRGVTVGVEALAAAERDQVYVSLCLAYLLEASRRGIWLPLVLDEPFMRLDARATAAMAAVLEAYCREGHQVIVFTGQREAADRLASVGAERRDMLSARRAIGGAPTEDVPQPVNGVGKTEATTSDPARGRRVRRGKKRPARGRRVQQPGENGQSEAA
jgi:hypothetical protein